MESNHALKRLMRRLSDAVFAMMRDNTPYDPDIRRRKQAEGGKNKAETVAAAKQRQEPCTCPSRRDGTISRPREHIKQREAELSPFDLEDHKKRSKMYYRKCAILALPQSQTW